MKNILLLKTQSQYEAMRNYIDEIEEGFLQIGFHTIVLDTAEQSFCYQIEELTESCKIDLIFTCNATCFEMIEKFPNAYFATYLCDHPVIHEKRLSEMGEKCMVFTCDRFHKEYIDKYMKNIKFSMFVPLSGSCSPTYIPYDEREHDVVFTGTYFEPKVIYEEIISSFSGKLLEFVKYMMDFMINNPDYTLEECLTYTLDNYQIKVTDEEFKELLYDFFGVDRYIRFYFRDKIIRTLIENNIKINVFGNGWEEFSSDFNENLIIEKGNYYIARKSIANTKISLNIMPWFKAGFQERIVTAMLSGTVAVTDESKYINEKFTSGEELILYSLNNIEELPQRITELLQDTSKACEIADRGRENSKNKHTWQHRTAEIAQFIVDCISEPLEFELMQRGKQIEILYREKNMRVIAQDAIRELGYIGDFFNEIQTYSRINMGDLIFLYNKILELFRKSHDNFPDLSISSIGYEHFSTLNETISDKDTEYFILELRNLRAQFLSAENAALTHEIQSKTNNYSKLPDSHSMHILMLKMFNKYENCDDQEIQEVIENIKEQNYVASYNYGFVKGHIGDLQKYKKIINYDSSADMLFLDIDGKNMYFPKGYSENEVFVDYNFFDCLEQDEKSPHRYLDENFSIETGDVVIDAGTAEGGFSLEIIEKVKKLYLVECEHAWIEALEKTFEPWKEKVVIIEKMIGATNDETHLKIDSFVEEDAVNFIKMDVEGSEIDSLEGAQRILRNSTNIKCAICSYHRRNAERDIKIILEKNGFFTTTTKGYMFFKEDNDSWIDGELRRGVVRGIKNI